MKYELGKMYGVDYFDYCEYHEKNIEPKCSERIYELVIIPEIEIPDYTKGVMLLSPEADELRELGFEIFDINDGKEIEDWKDVINFKFSRCDERYNVYDNLQNNLGIKIVSEKFKKLVEDNNIKGAQFLPLSNIKDLDNDCYLEGYYYMKIINVLPTSAIDLDLSWYEYCILRCEEILEVSYPAIKLSEVKGNDIYMVNINQFYHTPAYFSEKLVNLIKDSDLTGFDFYTLSQVRVSLK